MNTENLGVANRPLPDISEFGADAVLRGPQLADALAYLRQLDRLGLRPRRQINAEIEALIDRERSAR